LALAALAVIEVTQIIFVMKFLDWFKEHTATWVYPLLFSMSLIAMGIMTYFLGRGIWSLKNWKRK